MSMPRQWKPLKRHPGIYEYETKRGKKYGIRRSYTDINHKYRTWPFRATFGRPRKNSDELRCAW